MFGSLISSVASIRLWLSMITSASKLALVGTCTPLCLAAGQPMPGLKPSKMVHHYLYSHVSRSAIAIAMVHFYCKQSPQAAPLILNAHHSNV